MNWQIKATLMNVFSVSPGGDRLHYWTQRNLTKSLPRSEPELREKFGHAKRHLAALVRHGNKPVAGSQFYEFGAGRDLAIPLSLCALGVTSQILVDIYELARVDLINDALQTISRFQEETAAARIDAQPIPSEERDAWVRLLER